MKKIYIGLEQLLKQQGITRYELAKRTGISFQIVDNYYKNKVGRYDGQLLLKMCTALNCSIADLIIISDDNQ